MVSQPRHDDAIAIYEDRGVNFTERIDGRTWAGQSRSHHVYPQRPGGFEIAAIPVRVRYFSDSTGPRTPVRVSPPALAFEAVVPPGALDLPYFISTSGLEIEQSFDRPPETLKVGEAFTRTISITVEDALSMVIPPLPIEAVPGLAIYPDPPEVEDTGGERGQRIAGHRVERTTYVAEEAGNYRLPAVELAWWDVDAERLRTTSLPALEIRVEPNPDLVAEIPLPAEETAEAPAAADAKARVSLFDLLRRWGVPLAAAVLVFVLLSRLWRRYGPSWSRRLAGARRRHQESEALYFGRFRRAVRSGDPRATWNQWTAWLDRIHSGPSAATIRAFVDTADDPDLERESDALDALLFAQNPGSGWSESVLYRSVALARRRARSRARKRRDLPGSLNPF
ncbi:MAG: hypothetical protein V3T72_16415 [Thermoanaerobaculia bacterium]